MVDTKIIGLDVFGIGEKKEQKEEKKEEAIISKVAKLFEILEELHKTWDSITEKALEEKDYVWLIDHSNRPKLKMLRSDISSVKNLYPAVETGRLLGILDYDSTIGAEPPTDPEKWYYACTHELNDLRLRCFNAVLDSLKTAWVTMFARWQSKLASVHPSYGLNMGIYNQKLDELNRTRQLFIGEVENARKKIEENPENAYVVLRPLEQLFIKRKGEAMIPANEIRGSIVSRLKAIKYIETITERIKDDEKTLSGFQSAHANYNEIIAKLDNGSQGFLSNIPQVWQKYNSIVSRIRVHEEVTFHDINELNELGVKTKTMSADDYAELGKRPIPDYAQLAQSILESVGILSRRLGDIIYECSKIADALEKSRQDYDEKLRQLFLSAESFNSEWNRKGIRTDKLTPDARELLGKVNIYMAMIISIYEGKDIAGFGAIDRQKIGMGLGMSREQAIDFLDKDFGLLKGRLLEEAKSQRKTEEIALEKAEEFKDKVNRLINELRPKGEFEQFLQNFASTNKDIWPAINKNIPDEIRTVLSLRSVMLELLVKISKNDFLPAPKLAQLDIPIGISYEQAAAKIESLFNFEKFKKLLSQLADDIRAGKRNSKAA